MSPQATKEVTELHQLSALVADLEQAEDAVTRPFSGGRQSSPGEFGAGLRELKHRVYDILTGTEKRLRVARETNTSKGAGE